ncbi:MAG: helix-turn-helix domain-containing protein [Butyrivibrio sp.]|nr:helix-turn-helix domain-containing protein [Muribaculum sp.]MCM1551709.1 helix-turn-helix domain-containing protein [Butyrivibrio sp.]
MSSHLLISDAAKEVQVESHVLRYWEEELKLPIKRNELGHRYYTEEDVERFKQIKSMKERGLQLKAIKMILKDGRLDILSQEGGNAAERTSIDRTGANRATVEMAGIEGTSVDRAGIEMAGVESAAVERTGVRRTAVESSADRSVSSQESREEKAQRLQWIMQQLIRQAVQENNAELVQQIRESVLKELDYQFRMQEERDEERERVAAERTESYYRKLDELLRRKSSRKGLSVILGKESLGSLEGGSVPIEEQGEKAQTGDKKKKKRHFVF